MSQVLLKVEKLEEVEATAKSTIHAIQQEINKSANELANQNAEYQKQKQELEVGIGGWEKYRFWYSPDSGPKFF
jgi:hypothetical protein